MKETPDMDELFRAMDPFACRHEGVGLPGCPLCDSDLKRVAAAWRWLARTQHLELRKLREALNVPEVHDFMRGVPVEASHQRARWGTEHDAGKTDADWFWLVGYLAGKALHATDPQKRLHHQVTAAAALANWHAYSLGRTNMRPGIAGPDGEARS